MTGGRRRLGSVGAAVIAGWLTACAGTPAPPPLAETSATTSPAPPAADPSDLSPARRPLLADPPPPLPASGDAPERAADLLLAYSAWLHAARPDDGLVGSAFAAGTELERRTRRDLASLRRTGRRLIETTVDADVVTVISETARAASLRVVQDLTAVVLLGPDGNEVERVPASRTAYLVLLTKTDGGPWRLAAIDEEGPA